MIQRATSSILAHSVYRRRGILASMTTELRQEFIHHSVYTVCVIYNHVFEIITMYSKLELQSFHSCPVYSYHIDLCIYFRVETIVDNYKNGDLVRD